MENHNFEGANEEMRKTVDRKPMFDIENPISWMKYCTQIQSKNSYLDWQLLNRVLRLNFRICFFLKNVIIENLRKVRIKIL